MLEKFRGWYLTYQNEISWFIIGWCIQAGLNSLQRGDGITMLIDFALAYFNYYMWKHQRL
jgi:hypothetical protein